MVRLCEADRPAGIKAEVIRAFANMVILLDERFLSRQAVHKPVVRLIRVCVGDEEIDGDDDDGEGPRYGRIGSPEAEGYEEDLVDLMCHICSRIRSTPELLLIFFHDRRALKALRHGDTDDAHHLEFRPASPAGSTASTATLQPRRKSIAEPAESSTSHQNFEVEISKTTYEFPLFTYLLRFVHREGRTGELARAGLLFIVDIALGVAPAQNPADDATDASRPALPDVSLSLAEYMLDSDFADVLGAGLGAVYGLLPTKLAILRPRATDAGASLIGGGMSLGAGGGEGEGGASVEGEQELDKLAAQGVEASTSEELQAQVKLLVDLLEFAQDVLKAGIHSRAGGKIFSFSPTALVANALANSVAGAVRNIFLQNILYPSLLECSDVDGSAVAVMSYLDVVLNVIDDDGPLADVIVGYLIGEEDSLHSHEDDHLNNRRRQGSGDIISLNGEPESETARRLRRRKSRALILVEGETSRKSGGGPTQYFTDALGRYTLKDLILGHLTPTTSQATATAALKLTRTLLLSHGRFALRGLLNVIPDERATAYPYPYTQAFAPKQDRSSSPTFNDDDDEEFVYPGAEEAGKNDDNAFPEVMSSGMTVTQHMRELDLFLSLVSSIDPSHNREVLSTGYGNYLHDAEEALVSESTFIQGMQAYSGGFASVVGASSGGTKASRSNSLRRPEDRRRASSGRRSQGMLDLPGSGTNNASDEMVESFAAFKHRLSPHDSFLRLLLDALSRFFSHSPELNVALTGVLTALVLSPFRSLEGWLVFNHDTPGEHDVAADAAAAADPLAQAARADDDGDDRSDDGEVDEKLRQLGAFWGMSQSWASGAKSGLSALSMPNDGMGSIQVPVVLGLLRSLVNQVDRYRSELPGFDRYLAERRQGLMFVENLNDALGLDSTAPDERAGYPSMPNAEIAVPSLAVPAISPLPADKLWASFGIELSDDEDESPPPSPSPGARLLDDQGRRVNLPPPPSATPSFGLASSQEALPSPSENLTSSTQAAAGSSASTPAQQQRKVKGPPTGFASFFSPRPKAQTNASSSSASSLSANAREGAGSGPVSPFAQHYSRTGAISVQPHIAHSPKGPWTPARKGADRGGAKKPRFQLVIGGAQTNDEEDEEEGNFSYPGPSAAEKEESLDADKASDDEAGASSERTNSKATEQQKAVTLSALLDNVVILEEAIKELVATIQVRRGFGIDSLDFV